MEEPMPKTLDDEILEVLAEKGGLDLFDIMNAIERRRFNALPAISKFFFAPYRPLTFGFLLNPGTGVYERLMRMTEAGKIQQARAPFSRFVRFEYRLKSA